MFVFEWFIGVGTDDYRRRFPFIASTGSDPESGVRWNCTVDRNVAVEYEAFKSRWF